MYMRLKFSTARFRTLIPAALFTLLSAGSLTAFSFSTELDMSMSTYLQSNDTFSSPADYQLQIQNQLSHFEGPIQLDAEFRLKTSPLLLSIENLSATWYIHDYLDIRTGLLRDTWSPALFFPAVHFFSPQGLPGELNTGSSQAATLKLESTLYLRSGYLRVHVSPVVPDLSLPDTDSIWFPHDSFPSLISVRMPSGGRTIWQREELIIEHNQPEARLNSISGAIEAGLSTRWLDAAIIAYYGWNQRTIIEQNTEKPLTSINGEGQDFTMIAAPYYNRHFVAAGKLSSSYRSFWSWIEAAYSPHSAIALAVTSAEHTVSTAPFIGISTGAGWFLPQGWGTLLLESHYHHIFSSETFSRPALSRSAAALLDLSPPAVPKLGLKLGGILDVPRFDTEPALAAMTELQFRPDDQVLLYMSGLRFFSRRRSSFLYNYRNIQRLHIGMRLYI
ncbi:hypothetical protein [Spirochaeta dissipatitropha]